MCAGHYSVSSFWLVPWPWGQNCTCWLYSAVVPGEACRSLVSSLCSALSSLAFCCAQSCCPGFPRLQLQLLWSGNPPGLLGFPSLPCRLKQLVLATPFVCVSQEPLSLCCLLFSVLKAMISNVLSGYLVVFGGNLTLVPIIPSWLEAESLICIFLPRRTFPVLNGIEAPMAQSVLTLNVLTA